MKNFIGYLVMFSCVLTASHLFAQSDNFDDNNDAGWTRYDPIGSHPQIPDQATFTLSNGTYRIQTPPSPLPGTVGPARAGSLRTEVTYTDFFISVDIVDWDDTTDQSFGMLARIKEPGLGATDGYAMTFNIGGSDFDITWFTNEDPNDPNGAAVTVTGEDNFTMVKGRIYRFEFMGKGTTLTARAYELPNLTTPLVEITGTDEHYTSGFSGLLIYDNSDGTGPTDVTFDNYVALSYEPPRLSLETGSFGDYTVSWPIRFADFSLESTDTLTPPNWQPVTGVQQNDTIFYYLSGAEDLGKRFYRLKRP